MPIFEIMLIISLFIVPIVLLIWAFKKRKRLFCNSRFTAQTIWLQYQNQDKKNASELVDYQKEEKNDGAKGDLLGKLDIKT
jgi:hypothetical protein